MILLSNIIKAEYVVFDKNKVNKKQNIEHVENPVINTPQEDLFEIYNQREIIIKEAQEEAERIIRTAKKDAETEIAEYKRKGYEEGYNVGMDTGKSKGYKEGYGSGQKEALEMIEDENKEKVKEIAQMIESIEDEKEEIISKYESELIKLSIDIAEKIIRSSIDRDDDIVSEIITSVIKDYRNLEWIKVYISGQDDVVKIQTDKKLINALNGVSKDVKIEVLDELEKGSAIVETADGIVEASIDAQLNNFKEMVLRKNAG